MPRDNTTAHGSLSATLRQTVLGLEASGPTIWGARSFADVHVDFFGGSPYADYTSSTGTLRLRTAHARLDWADHSLIAALDAPLLTPTQPTSYVGIGEPPLAWSGNLWTWAPQLEWTNRLRLNSGKLGLDFALIDAPAPGLPTLSGQRQPNASERSRQPGYEAHVSYSIPLMDRSLTVGAGGYYSRHTYPYQQHIDAWAGTADWNLPLTHWLDLSGSLYRGRALGGLGAGVYKDYLTDPESKAIYGLDDEGGWSQLKARMTRSLEANFAIGEDAGFSSELRDYMEPGADGCLYGPGKEPHNYHQHHLSAQNLPAVFSRVSQHSQLADLRAGKHVAKPWPGNGVFVLVRRLPRIGIALMLSFACAFIAAASEAETVDVSLQIRAIHPDTGKNRSRRSG